MSPTTHTLSPRKLPEGRAEFVRLRFKTLEIPPIRDGVVLGRGAQVNSATMQQILQLARAERFCSVPVQDDVIEDILIRESILRKLDGDAVRNFVLGQIKPAMSATEILSLQLEVEVVLDQSF